jgi:membrane protease YdiL (CAAX protease family)
MTTTPPISRAALTTFLVLTFAGSAVWWWLIISGGSLGVNGGRYVFYLMWTPGTSALLTRLIFQRNLRGQGWMPGAPRYLAIAYFLPIAYAVVAYSIVWALVGSVDLARFTTPVATFILLGSLQSLLSATGEELGWRGFLVPALAQRMDFTRTGIVSGAIWAAWHVPLILFADYNSGTAGWYSVLCFGVAVTAMGVIAAWLRLRSGSVWTAAILHASHNLYVQGFFDRVTVDTGPTKWLTGEFGAALAIAILLTAYVFWTKRAPVATTFAADEARAAA